MPPAAPAPPPSSHPAQLAVQARQRFVQGLCEGVALLDKSLLDFFTALMSQTGTTREMQERRDAWMLFQKQHKAFCAALVQTWQQALTPVPPTPTAAARNLSFAELGLELLGEDVMDNKIVASRMALVIMEMVGVPFDLLRRRTQQLQAKELGSDDILRPETCCQLLVEQWVACGLERTNLQIATEPLQHTLAQLLLTQYQEINRLYDMHGVVQQTDLRVRRTPSAASAQGGIPLAQGSAAGTQSGSLSPTSAALQAAPPAHHSALQPGMPAGHTGYGSYAAAPVSAHGMTPMVRARHRAQGVMAQLRRLLAPVASGYDAVPGVPGASGMPVAAGLSSLPAQLHAPQPPLATQALAQALTAYRVQAETYYSGLATLVHDAGPQAVIQLVGQVREQSNELKKKAETDNEKAIIEVVGLMFQSILTEDRIPSAVRVWFARLQVPVLRVALAEPEFFNDQDHPARRLIDRMGACVMGFDASHINGSALEAEVKRIVQVIEQYPETGKRVFQLVYDEFEKFLSSFLSAARAPARLVSVAQQVEQRETLAVQYTIELRTLLKDMPVRDEIRDFLFKTWAEVLAMAAVRDGPQHADTLMLKHTAADLVWAASAKPSRSDRNQVIQSLPGLIARLRQGFALLGIEGEVQDAQLKVVTDTLAEAFLSKNASIPQAHIDALAKRLAHLEDFIEDADLGTLELSRENIEMMLGIDASGIQVMADTGAPVDEAMLAWAQELQLGAWFALDHNNCSAQVQYVWQSARKQLHLFAAIDGYCYLIQQRRLGAYLQARLLTPQDEEGITVRATRNAIAKIDANPERLLH